MENKRKALTKHKKAIITLSAAIVLGLAAVCFIVRAIYIENTLALAQNEYAGLRLEMPQPSTTAQTQTQTQEQVYEMPEEAEYEVSEEAITSPKEINPDYVGWIRIPGTQVDYPIVQGEDNEKYLHTTFEGSENPVGCIFMDSRVAGDFSGYNTIIYGHALKKGGMFGELKKYEEEGFWEKNPEIIITTPDGTEQSYRVFAARRTNWVDKAYQYEFSDITEYNDFAADLGSPVSSGEMLTLSTCINGAGENERLLIHAVP